MKFLLARECTKELLPSSDWKPEACAQECEVQKHGQKIHSSLFSSHVKINGNRENASMLCTTR